VIHHDDVVVGTHGRSFWILDNITPLRQFNAEIGNSPAHLFAPQLTYRVRRNNNPDTPLPPEEPAGQNPPDGAMIDYWIGGGLKIPNPHNVITVEIVDASGKVVRRFAGDDKPEPPNPKDLNVPMYWVRPTRTLSAANGMHRFVWDLTYPAPDVLSREYPISAIYQDTPLYPQGATVLPGKYTIRLSFESSPGKNGGAAGVWGKTQTLEVRMDPRVKTSPEDLRRQFELDRKLADSLHLDHEALLQLRSLREQLKSLMAQSAFAKAAADLDAKVAILEGTSGARYPSTPEGRSLTRLNGGFAGILNGLDSADAAPTTQQVAMYADLNKSLQQQLSAWKQIKSSELAALNEQLKKAGLPAINLSQSDARDSSAAATTSQDRDNNVE
jgi:hypothetical protein